MRQETHKIYEIRRALAVETTYSRHQETRESIRVVFAVCRLGHQPHVMTLPVLRARSCRVGPYDRRHRIQSEKAPLRQALLRDLCHHLLDLTELTSKYNIKRTSLVSSCCLFSPAVCTSNRCCTTPAYAWNTMRSTRRMTHTHGLGTQAHAVPVSRLEFVCDVHLCANFPDAALCI